MDASRRERAPHPGITGLLRDAQNGERGAREALFELVHGELRRRAGAYMKQQPRGHTLQATALVGEVYLRLFGGEPIPFQDRKHFLIAASRAMRHVLVDHARRRGRRRNAGVPLESVLDEVVVEYEDRSLDIEALQAALESLREADPAMALAIELRFFGGAEVDEVAAAVGLSRRTFERRWRTTKAWLHAKVR